MTPLAKWIKKRLEIALERFEEGQEPPPRIREQAIQFANFHRRATRQQWLDFASSLAEDCWRDAYLRGVEWAEREPPPIGERPTPEQLADLVDPTWRDRPWHPGLALEEPEALVPETRSPLDVEREQVAAMMARPRRF